MKIQLSDTEREILKKYYDAVIRVGRSGGFQGLTIMIYEATNATGELELTDAQLGRVVRYIISYGPGGFQDSFLRRVFRRVLRL